MSNKVTYGLEQVHIAFRGEDVAGEPSWETPELISGAVRFTPTAEGQESTFYADNGPYFSVTSNNGYTAELEMALMPDAILAKMLGWEIDGNGMLVEISDAPAKPFALMGQVQGDAKNRKFVYYECTASRPAKEHTTKGESIEPATDVLTLKIVPIEINGVKSVKGTIELGEDNKAAYDAFFNEVLVPSFDEGLGG